MDWPSWATPVDGARALLEPLVDWLDDGLESSLHADPFGFDPEAVAESMPVLRRIVAYYGTELRGFANVPLDEPVLFVGNHSGGAITMDPVPLMLRWFEERGTHKPLYSLGHNVLFSVPPIAARLRRIGCVPASHENAERVLDKGESLMVFPGGDYEVFRTWRERNRVDFGRRMGFIELAIRKGVRVVPMTIHGAHESTFVLTRGHRFAMKAGLDRLKLKVFPITWSIPFGVVPAFVPSLPLPAKITVELGRPIDWRDQDPRPRRRPRGSRILLCRDHRRHAGGHGPAQRGVPAAAAHAPRGASSEPARAGRGPPRPRLRSGFPVLSRARRRAHGSGPAAGSGG